MNMVGQAFAFVGGWGVQFLLFFGASLRSLFKDMYGHSGVEIEWTHSKALVDASYTGTGSRPQISLKQLANNIAVNSMCAVAICVVYCFADSLHAVEFIQSVHCRTNFK